MFKRWKTWLKKSYDANGRHLGKGNGDLNDLHNAIKS